jgi:hypothetical protein
MVSGRSTSIRLGLVKLGDDPLVVGLEDIFRNPFHSKDFDIQGRAIAQRIVDTG